MELYTQEDFHQELGLTPEKLFDLRFEEAERFVNRCARWTPAGKARIMSWKVFWNWYIARWNMTDEQLMLEFLIKGVPMYIDDYTLMHRMAFGEQLPPAFWKELIKQAA